MKTFNLQKLVLSLFIFFPIICTAQRSLISALTNPKTPTESIPFEFKKTGVRMDPSYTFMIQNDDLQIPDKFYKNVQMTEYDRVDKDYDLSPLLYRKFSIPNSSNLLAVVHFGGVTELTSDVLCVVNPNGQILSTLIGTIGRGEVTIRQFRINAQSQIITSTIVANTETSIPLESLTSFMGQRQDTTYSINAQGQFVIVSTQIFKPKLYTNSILSNMDINIWQGGEVVL